MKTHAFTLFAVIGLMAGLLACNDDDNTSGGGNGNPVSGPGTVLVDVSNTIGSVNLDVTGATSYTNASGETFSVTRLKYYISNVQLLMDTAVKYTMPESYFLIDESDQSSTVLALPKVPAGTYNRIRFMLGVDSLRNVSGAQSGALDPANGMFWTWSTGYIFYKFEGKSPSSSNPDSSFVYHIAGFRNANNTNATRWIEIPFGGSNLTVAGTREAEIHLIANHLRFFDGPPNTISIANYSNVMSTGGVALLMADNYADLFTFDHLHNDPN